MAQLAVFAALAEAEVDVGFAVHPLAPPGLASELLRQEPAVGRHRPTQPAPPAPAAPARGLADEPLVLWRREVAPGYYDHIVALLARAGLDPRAAHHPDAGADWAGQFAEQGWMLAPRGAPAVPGAAHVPVVEQLTIETSGSSGGSATGARTSRP